MESIFFGASIGIVLTFAITFFSEIKANAKSWVFWAIATYVIFYIITLIYASVDYYFKEFLISTANFVASLGVIMAAGIAYWGSSATARLQKEKDIKENEIELEKFIVIYFSYLANIGTIFSMITEEKGKDKSEDEKYKSIKTHFKTVNTYIKDFNEFIYKNDTKVNPKALFHIFVYCQCLIDVSNKLDGDDFSNDEKLNMIENYIKLNNDQIKLILSMEPFLSRGAMLDSLYSN